MHDNLAQSSALCVCAGLGKLSTLCMACSPHSCTQPSRESDHDLLYHMKTVLLMNIALKFLGYLLYLLVFFICLLALFNPEPLHTQSLADLLLCQQSPSSRSYLKTLPASHFEHALSALIQKTRRPILCRSGCFFCFHCLLKIRQHWGHQCSDCCHQVVVHELHGQAKAQGCAANVCPHCASDAPAPKQSHQVPLRAGCMAFVLMPSIGIMEVA